MQTENKKSFTSDEVNKIVEERLARERKQNENLSEIKAMLLSLKESGKLSGNSISELAKELLGILGEADSEGEAEAPEQVEDEAMTDTEVKFEGEIAKLCEVYPELDVNALISDEKFGDFYAAFTAEKQNADLLTVYEAYEKAKSIDGSIKAASKMKRTPSVHGARSGAENLLTPRQREIANHAGMSYKEYAELLSEIPAKKIRN